MDRFKNANNLPFVVAIQALALLLVAFFQTPQLYSSTSSAGAGGQSQNAPEALTSLSELPRDLQRERLPIPRFPEREKRNEPSVPTPSEEAPETTPGGEGSKLAALRVQNVAMAGPVAIALAAPMLGLPDSLEGRSLAGGNWLGGSSGGRRGTGRAAGPSGRGGGGMGGQGIGGGGGGYCPTPGRIGGGGRTAGGGAVSGGRGRPAGGSSGGGATTGTPSGGSRGRPAGTTGGSRSGGGTKGKAGRKS